VSGSRTGTSTNTKEDSMMKTPVIYYGAIAAFCVLTLCIGMVNAAYMTQPVTNWTGMPGPGHGHLPAPDEMITHLEKQGVDVTEVKTLLQNGDTAAVKAWLDAYRDTHKDQMNNCRMNGKPRAQANP
jgi:hypothetical protein